MVEIIDQILDEIYNILKENRLIELDAVDIIEQHLKDLYGEDKYWTETEINDLLWHDKEFIEELIDQKLWEGK